MEYSPTHFINRELSLINFQKRVLHEAYKDSNPLLERLKFFAIVNDNMDEFFMVRVGGLQLQNSEGVLQLSIDGRTPAEQLALIRKDATDLLIEVRKLWKRDLHPQLLEAGIHILEYDELADKQRVNVDEFFREIVFPVLTPLAFDPGHPFPHISNLSLNLAIIIEDKKGERHFARLKVPATLPRFVPIKRSSGGVRKDGTVPHNHFFVWLEQLISANLHWLFPGMKIISAHPFRVIRNADMVIQELEASDLLETMAESVRKRRFGDVVQLAINEDMPEEIREILVQNLGVSQNDVYVFDGPLGLSQLAEITRVDRYDLKDEQFIPNLPAIFRAEAQNGTVFSAIRNQDILLHHPYDSFNPVIEFLEQAARDPNVLAIKQTLYRVGINSPVVKALLRARRDYGKQVAVLVELKARFDEESNIGWARMLEREGVHVTYGLLGLKTHSKVTMVVRKEGDRIRRYVHLGTGNYNHITAQLYEDLGLFTCDEAIGEDATDLFNYLTGYSTKDEYRKLFVAPVNMREKLCELIEREIENGENGRVIIKVNALVDKPMIDLLYLASQAGVKIDLIVRGICCLRPGIIGVSENIKVISVIGRFLEHSRIYWFGNNGKPEVFLGSADLMARNLNARVEILYPITDLHLAEFIKKSILDQIFASHSKVWEMDSEGKYLLPQENEDELIDVQNHFLKITQENRM